MNRHILEGRLTNNPKIKYLDSGKQVCNFTIAVKRKYNREKTDFFPIVFWGESGNTIETYFKQGDPICILGETHINQKQDQNKKWHTNIEVEAIEFYFPLTKTKQESGDRIEPTKEDTGAFEDSR